jgi:2-deoxy-D-gluconate 3-dehydrogenase
LADDDTAGSPDAVRGDGFSADLSGRTAVVTGASSGLGRAIAELLLENGASVIGLQRRTDVQLGGDYTAVAADLADAASIAGVVEGILAERDVHILVNNAGINIRHRFEEFPLDDFDRVMQVNLRAVVELTQLFARPMLERGSGTVINIALRSDETRDRQIRERIPYGRWGRAEDIAGAALFLASPAAEYVHGVVLPVDGGYLGR